MKKRFFSSLAMTPFLLFIYWGGPALWVLALIVSIIGIYEFCNGWNKIDVHPSKSICYVMTMLLFLTSILLSSSNSAICANNIIGPWLFIGVATSLIFGWQVNKRSPYDSIATIATLVYIPFFAYHMILIDTLRHPFIWIVIIAALGSDIFAYFTGHLFGKHKIAPHLSPKKTIEGAIGGVIGSSLASWLFGYLFIEKMALICLLLGFVGGIAGIAGDFTASAFKRKMGIKDYSNLIPGHGGIMDRFDSVLFTAPVIYYLMRIILLVWFASFYLN